MAETMMVSPSTALRGTIRVPGDKSVTHRACFLGAVNAGRTTVMNPSPADDCRRSLALVETIGRVVEQTEDSIEIRPGEKRTGPSPTIDCGNSGTTARLAMGLLAAEPGTFTLTGDMSLSRRPMERVAAPLRLLGASIETRDGGLPATIVGQVLSGGHSHGIITVASAQVHAALAIAALRSRAGATLYVARPMRDHTLWMLRLFGCEPLASDAGVHRILPATFDRDVVVDVPGDFSSAAFLITAAVLVPDSEITIEGVGLNPTRIAYLRALERMGADVTHTITESSFEPVGTITARYSPALVGTSFGEEEEISIEEMIDELPLLALVATRASGRTIVGDASELRLKESDRIAATAAVLRALGGEVTEREDGFAITGRARLRGGRRIDPCGDHRLAMMAAIGAMISEQGATIDDAGVARVSYPTYWDDLASLGGSLQVI